MKARSVLVGALFLCVPAASCLLTTDLDGLDSGSEGGAGSGGDAGGEVGGDGSGGENAGGGAAGGGAAGGAPGEPAPDWSGAMTALYTFEAENDLGRDSSGNARDLVASGTLNQETVDAPQGQGTVRFFTDAALSGTYAALNPAGVSITYGGWVNIDEFTIDADVVDNRNSGSGYLARVADFEEALECSIGNGTSADAVSPDGSIPKGSWVHAVCRFDSTSSNVEAIINGNVTAIEQVPPLAGSTQSFMVGGELQGQLDEIFVTTVALSDQAVRRIYACGLSGKRCRCESSDPASYEHCGRRHPDCDSALPPCHQLAP